MILYYALAVNSSSDTKTHEYKQKQVKYKKYHKSEAGIKIRRGGEVLHSTPTYANKQSFGNNLNY